MEFSIKLNARSACVVVAVFENMKLSAAAQALDRHGEIAQALKSGDISGKPGTTLLLRGLAGAGVERVLLIGVGQEGPIAEKSFVAAVHAAVKRLASINAAQATMALPLGDVAGRDLHWALRCVVMAARENSFRTDALKSRKDPPTAGVRKIVFEVPASAAAKAALAQAVAIANGIDLCKELGNLPANICTPGYLATAAKQLGGEHGFNVEVHERKQLEKLKMGCFLSVTNGSTEPPKFIVLRHMGGARNEAPVVLVGKGITFDTGGISLKPGAGMDEMKYDMCGAAAVLGTFRTIGELGLKLNVIGLIAACENMPSGSSTRPGDIVTSMNGLTVEVQNTDAEGRLVLCDALTYAERFRPSAVIDIATLTGACVVALGQHNSGLFARSDMLHDALADELLASGRATGDTAWRMPLEDAYQEQIKSNFADLANLGAPGAGSVTAACFPREFLRAKKSPYNVAALGPSPGSGLETGRPQRAQPGVRFPSCRLHRSAAQRALKGGRQVRERRWHLREMPHPKSKHCFTLFTVPCSNSLFVNDF
nr:leucyl aminopeptidase [Massilia cavernae]